MSVIGTRIDPQLSSFVRKHVPDSDPGCAYAAFERAVEPLHSAISSFRPPNSSFPRRACPVPRYGAGIQRGGGLWQ